MTKRYRWAKGKMTEGSHFKCDEESIKYPTKGFPVFSDLYEAFTSKDGQYLQRVRVGGKFDVFYERECWKEIEVIQELEITPDFLFEFTNYAAGLIPKWSLDPEYHDNIQQVVAQLQRKNTSLQTSGNDRDYLIFEEGSHKLVNGWDDVEIVFKKLISSQYVLKIPKYKLKEWLYTKIEM